MIGEPESWVKRFDVTDYLGNRPMIEKLHEEKQLALSSYLKSEKDVKILKKGIHDFELENQRLKERLNGLSRKSTETFILGLIATIFIGLGVNIITSKPYTWVGWLLVIIACGLQITVWLLKPKKENV
jgi:hypothetical protein